MTGDRLSVDPGIAWDKDEVPAIDAPPDDDTRPDPAAKWPSEAPRTGICGAVTPKVVPRSGGGWRMFYTQILPRPGYPAGANDYDQATTRILSAASDDGLHWTPEPGVRLVPEAGGAGDFRVVSPDVVPLSGSGGLRMYFECCPGSAQTTNATIRSAVSEDDGLTWRVEPGERIAGDVSCCSPRLVWLEDGDCRLYYGVRGAGIASAVSQDGGLTFRPDPGLRLAPETARESRNVFASAVLRLATGGYRIYYAAYSAANRARVLTALSEDGLRWERDAAPALEPGGRWDRAKCSEMCVVELPGGAFRMYYEACDGTAADERGVWRICGATAA